MRVVILMLFIVSFISCNKQPLETVSNLDLDQYLGTWYEIARLPTNFEKNLECVTATYASKDNGKIDVLNKGYNVKKEKWEQANGSAKVPDSDKPGEIKVTFFWPFYGDYYVIDLDDDYQYALVGSPSRKYLWILARSSDVDENIYNQLVELAKDKGFPVEQLHKTKHDCDSAS